MARIALQTPPGAEAGHWHSLYRAVGEEVNPHRPVFTGDVFELGGRRVAVLQHPCALRSNGVDLQRSVLVAEVQGSQYLNADQWTGNYRVMPLPTLGFGGESHSRIAFVKLDVVSDKQLLEAQRLACLSEVGVNLLLQRWVHHNSRVVVPTHDYQEATGGPFEEAELVEEWCDKFVADGHRLAECQMAAHDWLRGKEPGMQETRQQLLEVPEHRSSVRRALRVRLRAPLQDAPG